MVVVPESLAQLAARLAVIDGAAPDDEVTFVPGFWFSNHADDFPPAAVARPCEWRGGDRLNIAFTQAGLSVHEQRRLLSEWCEVLPTLSSLKMLWFGSKASQDIFDAACRLANLEGLHLKWNSVRDLSAASGLRKLRHLHLGASSSVESLQPLADLVDLEWLQIDSPTKTFTLAPLERLGRLVGLGFTGVEGKKFAVPSLEPLSAFDRLRWLHLGAVHVRDESLRPLGALHGLQWLGLGNFFPINELAWLSTRLPTTRCDWLAPFARFHKSVFPCRICRRNCKVMTSGKGSRMLCPSCDSLKLARHVQLFESAIVANRQTVC